MIRRIVFPLAVIAAGTFSLSAQAQTTDAPPASAPAPAVMSPQPETPLAAAIRHALAALPAGDTDEDRNERAALIAFYELKAHAPLWSTSDGAPARAAAVIAELMQADAWGLDQRDFTVSIPAAAAAPDVLARSDIEISRAVLKYGRHARGGRIINPAEQLSSYLDRRPQLLKPASILDGIAAASEPDAYLRSLHPVHPQFEKLRQRYLTLGGRTRQSAEAKRILANMEQWRWMPIDMGEFYVWNNIPEFTQRVINKGELVRKERIVAGETVKQTPVFSRPLKRITFKPTWIVPDSIKVRELWPSLLRGGGLMREWGLEVRTKEGQFVDWRKVDWSKADIREYDVLQPNGPKSVMGKVKFSFPNQHTVFMHDTLPRDKYMFRAVRRTYSHGCMRVDSPIGLAEVLLQYDKGWDARQTNEALNTGPLNNELAMERKILIHTTYFTVLMGDDGKVLSFPDVYGHERRITQALDGKWNQINKGRDHLAPVELNMADASSRRGTAESGTELPGGRPGAKQKGGGSFLDTIFGTF